MGPITSELLLLMIFVSFIAGTAAILGGIIVLYAVSKFVEHMRTKRNDVVPPSIVAKSNAVGVFSIIYGLFFYFRIGYIINTNSDFTYQDWFLLDMSTGLFMLVISILVAALFRYRSQLNNDDKQE